MLKKILLSVLLLFALLVGFLAIAIYLDSIAEQQATGFCDAIPLAIPIDVAHFKQTVLRTQPMIISGLGNDQAGDFRFHINARHDVITEQTIAVSGMEELLNKSDEAYISVWFHQGFLLFGHGCEIHVVQQRVSRKRVAD